MQFKAFSYRAGVALEQFDADLRLSSAFDKTELLKHVKEILKAQGFTVDESTVSFKIRENGLYLEGLANNAGERKSIGFLAGN